VDRGIAVFIICADLVRRFEFAQNVWINDTTFRELGRTSLLRSGRSA